MAEEIAQDPQQLALRAQARINARVFELARFGNSQELEALFHAPREPGEPRPDPDAMDGHLMSALMWACYNKDEPTARTLLAHGANPNHRSRNNASPLGQALRPGNHGVIIALLDAGADPRIPERNGASLEQLAQRERLDDVAEMLAARAQALGLKEALDALRPTSAPAQRPKSL